uniref:Uncharacterized protein n=1 Tax=Opuntia streptacantha TaxID=393608 RepID=A0A7C9ENE9_OPUST
MTLMLEGTLHFLSSTKKLEGSIYLLDIKHWIKERKVSRSLLLLLYIVVSIVTVEDLRFQMRTKHIWKPARLSYLLVPLVVGMIFINLLGCLVLPLTKSAMWHFGMKLL